MTTSKLIYNREFKMVTYKAQVVNGLMLAAGFKTESQRQQIADKNKSKERMTLKDIKAKALVLLAKKTNNVDKQKQLLKAVVAGSNTSVLLDEALDNLTYSAVKAYCQALFNAGYISRVRKGSCYIYSVTDKGVLFIGVKDD